MDPAPIRPQDREPNQLRRGVYYVSSEDASQEGRDLEAFYGTTYRRLVCNVAIVAQSSHEAEEVVQEAFIRLIPRWDRISAYENPEAWVRAVALRQLSNRRRKTLRGVRALTRLGPPEPVPEPTGSAIDPQRALASLPRTQREVLVLQDLGLTLAEIAGELDLPLGTVKSRSSRARTALASSSLVERNSDVPTA